MQNFQNYLHMILLHFSISPTQLVMTCIAAVSKDIVKPKDLPHLDAYFITVVLTNLIGNVT